MNIVGRGFCIAAAGALLFVAAIPTRALAAEDLCAYGSGEPAIAACTQAIESGRFKGHALAAKFSNRGVERRLKQDLDGALADYNEAIRIDPKYADALYNRCVLYNRREDYDHALPDCSAAIRLGPSPNALNAAGDTHLTDDRSRSDYFTQRGIARFGRKEVDLAIADYNEALRLYPQSVRALNSRAEAYQAKGDTARADADMAAAKQLAK